MTLRPLNLTSNEVLNVLDGSLTQIRRVIEDRDIHFIGGREDDHDDPSNWGYAFDGPDHHGWGVLGRGHDERFDHGTVSIPCRFGEVGGRLYVRESFKVGRTPTTMRLYYRADDALGLTGSQRTWLLPEVPNEVLRYAPADGKPNHWRPASHMPFWASRIMLEVTSIVPKPLKDEDGEIRMWVWEVDFKRVGASP